MRKVWIGYLIFSFATMSIAAGAQGADQQRVEPLARVSACRAISDADERLRCFDREVTALDEAERKREIVIVSPTEIRAARRSLFGLRLPNLGLFGSDSQSDTSPEFSSIDTVVKRAERSGSGWLLTLDDDARWVQTDTTQLGTEPRPGTRIRIRKGALGSFLANIGNAPAIRIRRIN